MNGQKQEPTYRIVDLTLELAVELLGRNVKNRPSKSGAIERYAADMVAGRWAFTAEGIKKDWNGNLLDGQNRCQAVIQANELSDQPISIKVLLVEGLDPESQDRMDNGMVRTLGDQLARHGVSAYSQMAASVRMVVLYEADNNFATTHTKAEMLNHFLANEGEFQGAWAVVGLGHNTSGVNTSVLVAAYYLILRATGDEEATYLFLDGVRSGINLEPGHPALALRSRAQQARLNREKVDNHLMLLTVLRAWNFWRKNRKISKISIRPKGRVVRPEIEK